MTEKGAIHNIAGLGGGSLAEARVNALADRLAGALEINDASREYLRDLLQLFVDDVESWADERQAAYALATAYHETGIIVNGQMMRFAPVGEAGVVDYFKKYESGTPIGARLGNTEPGDGYRFRGRGFVQITGRNNYKKFSEIVDCDLVAFPDRALDASTAYLILREGMTKGLFTGKKLSDFIHGETCDFVNARRIINGVDRATWIARVARQIDQILHS
jgi:hypothetical protein